MARSPTGSGAPATAVGRDPSREVAERLPVTDRRSWLMLLGVALLVLGGLAWAVLGRAPETVSGPGMVVPERGFVDVGTDAVGTVTAVLVQPGDLVDRGDVVARLLDLTGRPIAVSSPLTGRVATVLARTGGVSQPGVPIAVVDPSASPLVVVAFLPAGSGQQVRPGMTALVGLEAVPQAQFGMVSGVVAGVSPLPATAARVELLLGGDAALAAFFQRGGPVLEVTVALDRDPTTPSGYTWTLGSGPDVAITAGSLTDVAVVVDDGSVLSRVLR